MCFDGEGWLGKTPQKQGKLKTNNSKKIWEAAKGKDE